MTMRRNSRPGMLYMYVSLFAVLLGAGGGAMAEEAPLHDFTWRPVGGGNSISCYVVSEDAFVCQSSCPAELISAEYTDSREVGDVGKVCCIVEDLVDSSDPLACQIEIELAHDKLKEVDAVDGLLWIRPSDSDSLPYLDDEIDVLEDSEVDTHP